MAIFELQPGDIVPVRETTFSSERLRERADLQRLLRERVEVVAPDVMVITEEFGSWEQSRRRIDLLALDRQANLVVIELKRTEDGGHMDLQAIRYAAMVSAMTFEQVVEVHGAYLERLGREADPREAILSFLGWDAADEDGFAQDVRIVLVAAEFSRELTTSVMWLNDRGIDVRCIRLKPYNLGGRILLDVQQIIPLPEVVEYQVQIRQKKERERASRESSRDWTRYDVTAGDEVRTNLAKRHAIFRLVKHLCAQGETPEKLISVIGVRQNQIFRHADGVFSPAEFVARVRESSAREGRTFDPPRYFIEADELIVSSGRTYAFTKMWGAETEQAMRNLVEGFPEHQIEFIPSDLEG